MTDVEIEALKSRDLELDTQLGAAKRKAIDDPAAEKDIGDIRAEKQRIADQIEGLQLKRKEEAAAEAARAKAAAAKERRKECNAASKDADERDAIAAEIDATVKRLGELRQALDACDKRLSGHFMAALRTGFNSAETSRLGAALHQELSGTFQSTDELIAAELITRSGVRFANVDKFEAVKPLRAGGFLERTKGRTDAIRRLIQSVLSEPKKLTHGGHAAPRQSNPRQAGCA